MIYVLLVIVAGGGGLSAEFESEDACEAARTALLADLGTQQVVSQCQPKA